MVHQDRSRQTAFPAPGSRRRRRWSPGGLVIVCALVALGLGLLSTAGLAPAAASELGPSDSALTSAPVLSWPGVFGAPEGVSPARGWPDYTTFTFAVRIQTDDDSRPSRMYVQIQRLENARTWVQKANLRLTAWPGDWNEGRICLATTTLPNGVYQYRFAVVGQDGRPATGDPTEWDEGPALQAVPQLWTTGLPGRARDYLNPTTGTAGRTRFNITLQYTDSQGNRPLVHEIEIQKMGTGGAWEPYTVEDLEALDGTPRTGQFFGWTGRLPAGQYQWRVYFRDLQGPATADDSLGGNPMDWLLGPTVNAPPPGP